MLVTNLLLSLCLPPSFDVPLVDKSINQEESRLFSKFIKDQCWQKVGIHTYYIYYFTMHFVSLLFSFQLYQEEIQKDGD